MRGAGEGRGGGVLSISPRVGTSAVRLLGNGGVFPMSYSGLFMGHNPTRGPGQEVFETSRARLDRVGSDRVGLDQEV